MKIALCEICHQPMSGSRLLLNGSREANITVLASLYMVHLIDKHWEIVERIRSTTDDPDGRRQLYRELFAELR